MANKAILYPQQIADDGGGWKYFAPMLHIDDDDLDPYEYRLLGHYRRVCGVNGGKCSESVETTAAKTKMSVGKVSQIRRRLCALKRINLTEGGNNSIIVTLRDCWLENILRYTPSSDETSLHQVKADSDKPSSGEGSLHVVKQRTTSIEKPDNKQPEKENTLSDVPSDAPPVSEPSSEKKAERQKNPLQEAVCFAFYLKPGGYAGKLGKWLTGGDVEGEEYQRNPIEEPATPEEIIGWRLWLEDKYEDVDKAKRFRPQKIKGIRESFEDHFRGAADHEKWLKKGAKQLDRLLGIQRVIFEPAPDVRPPLEVNMPPAPVTPDNDDFEAFNAEIDAGVAELMHIFGDHAGASNEKDRAWLLARKQAYLESQHKRAG